MGINDATNDEIVSITGSNIYLLAGRLAKLINVRAQLGWATHGHSSVDVNLVWFIFNLFICSMLMGLELRS